MPKNGLIEDKELLLLDAMIAGTGPAIEAQEKRGQQNITRAKDRLPIDGTSGQNRAKWEAAGFVFGADIPERGSRAVFVECTFPAGWKLVATDHSMWSKLIDSEGRERSMMFFKAAIYDYNAHIDPLSDV